MSDHPDFALDLLKDRIEMNTRKTSLKWEYSYTKWG